jgi:hypothetical protein
MNVIVIDFAEPPWPWSNGPYVILNHSSNLNVLTPLLNQVFLNSSSNTIPGLPPLLPSSVTTFSTLWSSHFHLLLNSSGHLPSMQSTIRSPITGKNLYPCPLPPVAKNSPSNSGWWEMRKSPLGVSVYQHIRALVKGRLAKL